MDDNPYESPKCEPEVEERATGISTEFEPLLQTVWVRAVLHGFMALGGLVMSQMVIVITFWPDVAPTWQQKQDMLPMCTMMASPIALLMALWTWRAPNSKLLFLVAFWLAASGFILGMISMAVFPLE